MLPSGLRVMSTGGGGVLQEGTTAYLQDTSNVGGALEGWDKNRQQSPRR